MQQQQQAAVDESHLSFDDIMKSVADVKSLVGSSGMEGRALGEFLESNWYAPLAYILQRNVSKCVGITGW